MKQQGEFIFRGEICGTMRYGGIILEVESIPVTHSGKGELVIDFGINNAYQNAVSFGIEYFFDNYSKKYSVDLMVNVLVIRDMPLDTSNGIITYATVMAMLSALDATIEGFFLDKATGILALPLNK